MRTDESSEVSRREAFVGEEGYERIMIGSEPEGVREKMGRRSFGAIFASDEHAADAAAGTGENSCCSGDLDEICGAEGVAGGLLVGVQFGAEKGVVVV